MVKEISVRPKAKNNNAKIAFFATLFLSAIGFVTYFMMERYRGFVGMVSLMVLITAILIYTKYIAPVFTYDIALDVDGAPIFIVRQTVGRRISTLCRVWLSDVSSIEREDKATRKAHKTPVGFRKYIYAPTMFPSEVYRLTLNGRYEKSEIVIECSEEFADLLREAVAEAKALNIASEE